MEFGQEIEQEIEQDFVTQPNFNIAAADTYTVDKPQYKTKISDIVNSIITRLVDILFGTIGCIILIPVTLLVIILQITSGERVPLIYKQKRIGKNGKEIMVYKFTTMVKNAEQKLEELMNKDSVIKEEYTKNKKLKNDPRIIRAGKFLRKTSLDEFPQFFNVLIGNMTMFGPRPYMVTEKDDMGRYYYDIIKMKPGLTGPWQTGVRNDTTFDDRLKIESEFVYNKTLSKDIKLFFKSFMSMVRRTGE